jgi:hypothetical protein
MMRRKQASDLVKLIRGGGGALAFPTRAQAPEILPRGTHHHGQVLG